MGGKKSKEAGGKPIQIPNKKQGLTSKDIDNLSKQTGLTKDQIQNMYSKFMANNPDGQLDKREFARLYDELRPESPDKIDEIAGHVFRAFDGDNNGSISFGEFLVNIYRVGHNCSIISHFPKGRLYFNKSGRGQR